jgi:hypothetical protein
MEELPHGFSIFEEAHIKLSGELLAIEVASL